MLPSARFLFRLRVWIGRAFGWDRRSDLVTKSTFVSRVSAADYEDSIIEPGTVKKSFLVVYSSANKHLAELEKNTLHAVLAVASIEREPFSGTGHLSTISLCRPGNLAVKPART